VTARRGGATALAAAERAADRSRRLQALTAALSEAATVEQVADVIVFRGHGGDRRRRGLARAR
jgi:hypothetical protein